MNPFQFRKAILPTKLNDLVQKLVEERATTQPNTPITVNNSTSQIRCDQMSLKEDCTNHQT